MLYRGKLRVDRIDSVVKKQNRVFRPIKMYLVTKIQSIAGILAMKGG